MKVQILNWPIPLADSAELADFRGIDKTSEELARLLHNTLLMYVKEESARIPQNRPEFKSESRKLLKSVKSALLAF